MAKFIFRMPGGTPELTYEGLMEYICKGRSKYGERKIGSTVEVSTFKARGDKPSVRFRLYSTTLAFIGEDFVRFTQNGANDQHMATGYWLDQIARDNHLGYVYRYDNVRYLLGDYDGLSTRSKRPIAGCIFTVGRLAS